MYTQISSFIPVVVLVWGPCVLAGLPDTIPRVNMVNGDTLDTPEWLQDIPLESKVAKYRKRRFLVPSAVFDAKFTLAVPGEPVFGLPLGIVALKSIFTFTVPSSFVIQLDGIENFSLFQGRDIPSNRTHLYEKVQSLLSSWGFEGRPCFLRTMCELAEIPFKQGLIGEIINFLFRIEEGPSHYISNSIEDEDEYIKARHHGKHVGQCGDRYPKCPISILKGFARISS